MKNIANTMLYNKREQVSFKEKKITTIAANWNDREKYT